MSMLVELSCVMMIKDQDGTLFYIFD